MTNEQDEKPKRSKRGTKKTEKPCDQSDQSKNNSDAFEPRQAFTEGLEDAMRPNGKPKPPTLEENRERLKDAIRTHAKHARHKTRKVRVRRRPD